VWSGSEVIVWGGQTGGNAWTNTGGRYDPSTDQWSPTTLVNAPSPRAHHTAVWTGAEMIVWGGWGGEIVSAGQLYSGGRYNPAGDTWAATDEVGSPSARTKHTAVWTGGDMIVWGGEEDGYLNTGGHYVP
jgi:N-acetylneuraminic acid mutarotase